MRFDNRQPIFLINLKALFLAFFLAVSQASPAQTASTDQGYVAMHFYKVEKMIPMRDGVRLFTAIYIPKQMGAKRPILMERTPYSCSPYGEKALRPVIGPNLALMAGPYIFVYQDVRGRYRSEGRFDEMTPSRETYLHPPQTDESTDTYDTIEWLLKHLENTNGRVGIYGISYPGFYATAALINAHPAIKAVSPQAPVTDEFIGDDAYHNGAFFLLDNFDFTNYFQGTRLDSGKQYKNVFSTRRKDAYQFFLNLGPISNTNGPSFFNHKAKIWDEYLEHNTYDNYWKSRNIRTSLKKVRPAVLVVGGLFDAEDMFGALRTYEAIERQNPINECRLILGPWTHGAWSEGTWSKFGPVNFGQNINGRFTEMETAFFDYYLLSKGEFKLPEVTVFETGSNQWTGYRAWPPPQAIHRSYFLQAGGGLTSIASKSKLEFSAYTSDPANPVPYTQGTFATRNDEYLVEDQRFAARRPDVLSFAGPVLDSDLRATGRVSAALFVSTGGTDADFIVKVIDVLPGHETDPNSTELTAGKDGFQRLVRAEVFRGKFRNSYENPEPFIPGQISSVHFDLNEIAHTFKKGHRIMIQIQSSWFPLVDRNPQKFTNIGTAGPGDFQSAQIRIYHDAQHPSSVTMTAMP